VPIRAIRGAAVAAALLAAALVAPAAASAAAGDIHPASCRGLAGATRCGYLEVPWDRTGAIKGTTRVWFEFDRASAGRSRGTLTAMEGGPGYATSDSRDFFRDIYGPLLKTRDLVLVDARGTGKSGAVNCPLAQKGSRDVVASGRQCARILGKRIALYRTAASTDDVADVLRKLGVSKATFYGDSYGTFFGQTFMHRHPGLLDKVVLDGTYPAQKLDPVWADLPRAVRAQLRLLCARTPSNCSGDPVARARRLTARLAGSGLRGSAPGFDGKLHQVRFDQDRYASFGEYASSDPVLPIYHEFDPATRAALAGDARPILRLQQERGGGDGGAVAAYSAGLSMAVTCLDYPQLWDTAASNAVRRQQLRARIAATPRSVFHPFTAAAWWADPLYAYETCQEWPVRAPYDPPIPDDAALPAKPTLILNGDLDAVTTPEGARLVASRIPGSIYVSVKNAGHVTTYSRDSAECAIGIVQAFVAGSRALPTRCAAQTPNVRPVRSFPLTAAGAPNACRPGGGPARALRVATAALMTLDDAARRLDSLEAGAGLGLRAGSYVLKGTAVTFRGARFTRDLAVSGRLARRGEDLAGTVTLAGAATGTLTVRPFGRSAYRAAGTVGGARVSASCVL
jgi:pimeloyl-ACP methyl ester carboxylesterase